MQFCEVLRSCPLQPQPEIFGLHVNADITCQQAETYELLNTVLGLQPRTTSSSSAADSQEAVVARVARGILDKVRAELTRIARWHAAVKPSPYPCYLLCTTR